MRVSIYETASSKETWSKTKPTLPLLRQNKSSLAATLRNDCSLLGLNIHEERALGEP
ncbi:protein of unknown function [Methylocaldum szegediense]|uniref:Uncharacterized protein n=1 Tax=Methylocaldum szegediense TaxID=73780 RepID=A0ABN8X622_9GAMM|nr:protein of unknown function [Methylocaldum szegediense]